jgi:hypothetical protein
MSTCVDSARSYVRDDLDRDRPRLQPRTVAGQELLTPTRRSAPRAAGLTGPQIQRPAAQQPHDHPSVRRALQRASLLASGSSLRARSDSHDPSSMSLSVTLDMLTSGLDKCLVANGGAAGVRFENR